MEDFSAVIIAKNEEHHLPALMASLAGVEDIVIVDDGSEDRTAELGRELGARVFEVGDRFSDQVPTEEDVEAFIETFGWMPSFDPSMTFFRCGDARNHAAAQAVNDYVFNPDCDEIVEWDLAGVRADLEGSDQLSYPFQHTERERFRQAKFYRKSKLGFVGRVHEVVMPIDAEAEIVRRDCDHLRMTHHQPPELDALRRLTYRALEFAVVREGGARNLFYLGREYGAIRQFDRCLATLARYLEVATWSSEIAEALFIRAQCYLNLKQYKEAKRSLLSAVGVNPDFRQAFQFLSALSSGREAESWMRHAAAADNGGVLFVRDIV